MKSDSTKLIRLLNNIERKVQRLEQGMRENKEILKTIAAAVIEEGRSQGIDLESIIQSAGPLLMQGIEALLAL